MSINNICPYCEKKLRCWHSTVTVYLHKFVNHEGYEPTLQVHVGCFHPLHDLKHRIPK